MKPYYERNGIAIFCGDCREVLPALLGQYDVIVSDPPYGIGYDASTSTQSGIQQFQPITGDDEPFDPTPFLNAKDVLLWGANNFCHLLPPCVGQWYAWDKVVANDLKVRIAEYEFAWHKCGTKPRGFRHLWSGAYRASEAGEKSLHPNQKPVALMRWCLGLVEPGIILDPFMGSGTTIRAAKDVGRKAIGIEIDERYAEIAANRLAQECLF